MFDFKQIQQMQKDMQTKMDSMQKEMEGLRCEGQSGGGMVKVELDGNQKCVSVKIQPDAVDPDDIEMIEDLVLAAFNAAVEKSKDANQSGLAKVTGGIKIPGLTM